MARVKGYSNEPLNFKELAGKCYMAAGTRLMKVNNTHADH